MECCVGARAAQGEAASLRCYAYSVGIAGGDQVAAARSSLRPDTDRQTLGGGVPPPHGGSGAGAAGGHTARCDDRGCEAVRAASGLASLRPELAGRDPPEHVAQAVSQSLHSEDSDPLLRRTGPIFDVTWASISGRPLPPSEQGAYDYLAAIAGKGASQRRREGFLSSWRFLHHVLGYVHR